MITRLERGSVRDGERAPSSRQAALATEPDAQGPLRQPALGQNFQAKRVLLAEDHAANRELMAEQLRDIGPEVDLVTNGVGAVAMAARTPYGIVLTDRRMPLMDEVEATRAIRLLPGYAKAPIVAVTGDAFVEERSAWIAAGINECFAKPVRPDVLCSVVSQWLRKASQFIEGGAG